MSGKEDKCPKCSNAFCVSGGKCHSCGYDQIIETQLAQRVKINFTSLGEHAIHVDTAK